MKRSNFGLVGATAVSFSLALLAHAADDKSLIKPGESIGQVYVGMEDKPLRQMLGEPSASDSAMTSSSATWYSKRENGQVEETTVFEKTDENHDHSFVRQVLATSSFFHTRDGISTASSLDAIWKEFPGLTYCESQGTKGASLELYDAREDGFAILVERLDNVASGAPWGKCRAVIIHHSDEGARFIRIGKPEK